MGKGTGIKDTPGIHGLPNAGKMQGGGVNLAPKKENTGGGMDLSQRKVMAGAYDSFGQAKVISGGHPKGGFMHKSKSSMPKVQGYDAREDESLGEKDGKESTKSQSMKSRRDEREGADKAQDKDPDGLTRYGKKKSVAKSEKLKMVKKAGKMVPFYAADGIGDM